MHSYLEFYAELYREKCFERPEPNMVEMLQMLFVEEEIRMAVLERDGDKALGPNGFMLKFCRRIGDC